MRQVDKDYSYMNNEKINQEDLYIGNSGNPWNASSTRIYDKDIHVHTSSNKTTANNMKSQSTKDLEEQLSIRLLALMKWTARPTKRWHIKNGPRHGENPRSTD
ncbi:hypothetical protein G5I_00852 [Acromyrmex echinatior]|uniref:Uncharacterized protein n=1 Tax=Acromyrmex echinatior TaxID=103372 RepID=F4W601_ACREC|nr:hypothetical protein G5I_00852 [Acromyrmex echinatior]